MCNARQWRRHYAICIVMSSVTGAGKFDYTSYAPRRWEFVPGRAPNRDGALIKGLIDMDKDYFNRLDLFIVER